MGTTGQFFDLVFRLIKAYARAKAKKIAPKKEGMIKSSRKTPISTVSIPNLYSR